MTPCSIGALSQDLHLKLDHSHVDHSGHPHCSSSPDDFATIHEVTESPCPARSSVAQEGESSDSGQLARLEHNAGADNVGD
jgi:hypothetical protein